MANGFVSEDNMLVCCICNNFWAQIYYILGARERDVIMWMDHRAKCQADTINATNHPVLQYVGGKISLEMQMPKLLWLKQVRIDMQVDIC